MRAMWEDRGVGAEGHVMVAELSAEDSIYCC